MNQPSPAIVTQGAATRLPRVALLALCAAYVLAGFVDRAPWRTADLQSFGIMWSMALGEVGWLSPGIALAPVEPVGLLSYWIGALAIWLMPVLPAHLAARLPFIGLLALTLAATWYATFHLARRSAAQPVAFAFGGEASGVDYARALADGAVLALLASLGLAQMSHETTPALAQLAMVALAYYGAVAASARWRGRLAFAVGMIGLALAGAPGLALALSGLALVANVAARSEPEGRALPVLLPVAVIGICAVLSSSLGLWSWSVVFPAAEDARSFTRLALWFTWPCWPLLVWTLWRWRRQWSRYHLLLPASWAGWIALSALLSRADGDRTLFLLLPPLATLAAFALPTFRRSVAALIDWFTLVFFTTTALVIWVYWIAMHTGWPRRPALTVAKFAPGFEPVPGWLALVVAAAATLGWLGLVAWRAGRHRPAMWRSLVLPAGGAVLAWVLLATLWMPLLDYVRSYESLARRARELAPDAACVSSNGLNALQVIALRYHARLDVLPFPAQGATHCDWLARPASTGSDAPAPAGWKRVGVYVRPTDPRDRVEWLRRADAPPASSGTRPAP